MREQVFPEPNVTARWTDGSKYPDLIWVRMSDGTTVKYSIYVEQPRFSPWAEEEEVQHG